MVQLIAINPKKSGDGLAYHLNILTLENLHGAPNDSALISNNVSQDSQNS